MVTKHQNKITKRHSKVAKWAAQFKYGRESLEYDPSSGRFQITYTAENIKRVRAIIEDLHATHDIIEAVT